MSGLDVPVPAVSESIAVQLREGRTVMVRHVTADDSAALTRLLEDIPAADLPPSPTGAASVAAVVTACCRSAAARERGAWAAWARLAGTARIVAVGWYAGRDGQCAECTLLVTPDWRNRGLASALLGMLSSTAAAQGFHTFHITAPDDDDRRFVVLSRSGLPTRVSRREGRCHAEVSLTPTDTSVSIAAAREQANVAASLRPLLAPGSVAVVGASRDSRTFGRRILDALVSGGFGGRILPVNPSALDIGGLRCYPSIADTPGPIDLAVVAVRAEAVPTVLAECGRAGVRATVVIASGFADAGDVGRREQDRLCEESRADGLRLVGPNSMGVLNASRRVRLNASLAPSLPPSGGVALASQSGGVALATLELAARRGLGFSTVVSLGNKADVSGNDLLLYGAADPDTAVILFYLESFGNPRRFTRLARRVSRDKPIVVVKSGRTRADTRANARHAAELLAQDDAVDAMFHQAGVIRADTIDEMLDLALLLDTQPLPGGNRIAVLTNTGGPGILAADACAARGLVLPALPEETTRALAAFLPPHASLHNPVDLTATANGQDYYRAVRLALASRTSDALLVIYTEVDRGRTVEVLAAIEKAVSAARDDGHDATPVLACVLAAGREPLPLHAWGETIPVYPFPEHAARALAGVRAYARWREEPAGVYVPLEPTRAHAVRTVCERATVARGETWLTFEELTAVFASLQWPFVGRVAHTTAEALAHAASCGYPVAAQLASPHSTHKMQAGAVRLNLGDDAALIAAFDALTALASATDGERRNGVLVQPMVEGGLEMFAGLRQDPLFGPLVAFGMGGTSVEVLHDVAFAVCPLTDADVTRLVRRIRGAVLLDGDSTGGALDVAALEQLLSSLSQLGATVPEILEIDLSPVLVLQRGRGVRLVDARMRVRPRAD